MQRGLISMLCPSRGRPGLLRESVGSLLSLAARPQDVEVLAAIDPDDPGSVLEDPRVLFWVAPERYGYGRLHEYYNALAATARGEWLMLWNDDAFMETQGWDQVIRDQPPGVLWATACNPLAPPGSPSEFPAIPTAWVRHLGHVSLHFSCDMWVDQAALLSGTGRHVPISIRHGATDDATASERDFSGTGFNHPAMVAARRDDAAKILELLG